MNTWTILGITLSLALMVIWIMIKLSAGHGIQLHRMDPTQPYQVEWVISQEENQDENWVDYVAEERAALGEADHVTKAEN